jgi:hypothetical protein
MSKLEILCRRVDRIAEAALVADGDFDFVPAYEDGLDYPSCAKGHWLMYRVCPSVRVRGGEVKVELHQMSPSGGLVVYALQENLSDEQLEEVLDRLGKKCWSVGVRYLHYVHYTGIDPLMKVSPTEPTRENMARYLADYYGIAISIGAIEPSGKC